MSQSRVGDLTGIYNVCTEDKNQPDGTVDRIITGKYEEVIKHYTQVILQKVREKHLDFTIAISTIPNDDQQEGILTLRNFTWR